ncbi:hypothetical protein IDM40_19755 [Nocardiopsis sp. HNM0947]|uniref:Uncharacterized protein n=1 Tax=Nocardiopsis coralli TaxID=2772213 RepID=A0ABR9PAP6_9ACTN|nr:hypothetical protein [Nocardiopsis coralli]MBE3000909.1 hypothetical protein [Nocardiopsis coralli]
MEQFLVDVESGERFEGEAFEGDLTPDERVTLTDEGSVSADWLPDDDAVEYRHVSFEGDKLEEALVPARPSEMKSDPGVLLGDGVLRLSHLTVPDLDRGPVEAEFVEWGSEGEPAPIEVGLIENSDEWRQAEYEENRSVR